MITLKPIQPEIQDNRQWRGFTLTEVLIALMVASIVLAAAATIADAMSLGKHHSDTMTRTANYQSQLFARLSDVVMRAETVAARPGGGVLLTGGGADTAVYTDDDHRIVIDQDGKLFSYIADPSQTNVTITAADTNRVVITFDSVENGVVQTYMMTAARRGGE